MDEITFGVPWHFLDTLSKEARTQFFNVARSIEKSRRQNHRNQSRHLQVFDGYLLHSGDRGSFDEFSPL